jgi:hypothetical protein
MLLMFGDKQTKRETGSETMNISTIIGIILVGLVLTGAAANMIGSAALDTANAVNAHNQAIIDATTR